MTEGYPRCKIAPRSWSTCCLSAGEFLDDFGLLGEVVNLLLQMPSTTSLRLRLDHGIIADLIVTNTVPDFLGVFGGALAQGLAFPK